MTWSLSFGREWMILGFLLRSLMTLVLPPVYAPTSANAWRTSSDALRLFQHWWIVSLAALCCLSRCDILVFLWGFESQL
jgi:hypothetical protein